MLSRHYSFICRELSKGHFSDDNQKRLNGPDIDIPVFEAKMTRDSRLVVWPTSRSTIAVDAYLFTVSD